MTKSSQRQQEILVIIAIFTTVVTWRLALFGVAAEAESFLIYSPSFPYSDSLIHQSNLPRWVSSWANFDGVHYLTIIREGYLKTGLIQAFFPVLPILIKAFISTYSISWSITLGLIISLLSLLGGVFIWWWYSPSLLKLKIKNIGQFRWIGLFLILLFPTSFFYGALYTEALFFLLSISTLILGAKRHFVLASLLAGLASGTRLVGVFLVPALLLEYWWPCLMVWWQGRHVNQSRYAVPTISGLISQNLSCQQKWKILNQVQDNSLIKSIFISLSIILIGSSGLWLYSGYLQRNFNDPLYFFSVQSQFGAGREKSIILYPQTAWRAAKILLTARQFDWKYYVYTQEFLVGIVGLIAIIWSAKYVRPSIWLFSLLTFLLPTLTGTFSSMPRYFLTSHSVFLALAFVLSTRRKLTVILLLLSTILLILNTMLFIQGYWVA